MTVGLLFFPVAPSWTVITLQTPFCSSSSTMGSELFFSFSFSFGRMTVGFGTGFFPTGRPFIVSGSTSPFDSKLSLRKGFKFGPTISLSSASSFDIFRTGATGAEILETGPFFGTSTPFDLSLSPPFSAGSWTLAPSPEIAPSFFSSVPKLSSLTGRDLGLGGGSLPLDLRPGFRGIVGTWVADARWLVLEGGGMTPEESIGLADTMVISGLPFALFKKRQKRFKLYSNVYLISRYFLWIISLNNKVWWRIFQTLT